MHNINHAMCAACGLVLFLVIYSYLVLTNAIISGKRKEIAHTIRTFMNLTINLIWEVSGFLISSTFKPQKSKDGIFAL